MPTPTPTDPVNVLSDARDLQNAFWRRLIRTAYRSPGIVVGHIKLPPTEVRKAPMGPAGL